MTEGSNTSKQEYLANSVLLFFVSALGIGLTLVALSEYGSIPFEMGGPDGATVTEANEREDEFFSELALEMVAYSMVVAPIFGAVVGIWAGGVFEPGDEIAFVTAAAGFVGGFVFVMLVGSLAFVTMSEAFMESVEITSLNFETLVENAIVSAAGTALVSAGSAYAAT